MRSIQTSQEAFLAIMIYKTMQTQPFLVNKTFWKISFVPTKGNILPIEVPVSCFYLSQQHTLGVLTITEQLPHTHIIGKQTEYQRIPTIAFEVFKAFSKVGTKQRVRLPLRHIGR